MLYTSSTATVCYTAIRTVLVDYPGRAGPGAGTRVLMYYNIRVDRTRARTRVPGDRYCPGTGSLPVPVPGINTVCTVSRSIEQSLTLITRRRLYPGPVALPVPGPGTAIALATVLVL